MEVLKKYLAPPLIDIIIEYVALEDKLLSKLLDNVNYELIIPLITTEIQTYSQLLFWGVKTIFLHHQQDLNLYINLLVPEGKKNKYRRTFNQKCNYGLSGCQCIRL